MLKTRLVVIETYIKGLYKKGVDPIIIWQKVERNYVIDDSLRRLITTTRYMHEDFVEYMEYKNRYAYSDFDTFENGTFTNDPFLFNGLRSILIKATPPYQRLRRSSRPCK